VVATASEESDSPRRASPPPAPVQQQQYGKQLGYESVFEGRTSSVASESR
jgi:hypothetical protein